MASECIFCGGACGRVCRGLGFKNTKEASGTTRKVPGGPLSGGPSRHAPAIRTAGDKRPVIAAQETGRGEAGQSPRLIQSKRGRPRIGEQRAKPWEAAGMSERTWYRRQKEKSRDA